jgi:hypothetical protein
VSLPFYGITCSGCDFLGSYSYGIRYAYEGPPDHEPVLEPAWCRLCNEIVMVCAPFTRECAQLAIADLNMVVKNNRGIFRRLSKSRQQETQEANEELQAIYEHIQHFEEVPFKSRCLECGGHDVFPFDLPDGDYDEVEKLDIEHSCGGHLLISMKGRLMFGNRPEVIYNNEGEAIKNKRESKA